MNEKHHEEPHTPLSYHGAWRIVWLVFLLFIVWLILRALQPVILLFALVLLLAMVLNPIVVWLQKHRVPRLRGVAGHSHPDRIAHTKLSGRSRGVAAHGGDRRKSWCGRGDGREFFAAL